MKLIKFALLILSFSFSSLLAVNTDSTLAAMEKLSPEKRTEVRLDLAYRLSKNNLSSSLEQSDIAYKESVELKNKFFQAQAIYYKGLAYYYVSAGDSAVANLEVAMERFTAINNRYYIGMCLYYLGTAYLIRDADQEKAMEYYYNSIPYCVESDNFRILGANYSSIGNIFRMNGAYENALDWITKAEKYYQLANYSEGRAWIYYSIGRLYDNMKLFNEAEDAFYQSLEIYRNLAAQDNNTNGVSICLDQLCAIYLEQNKLEKAQNANKEAFKNYSESGSLYGISNTYKNSATISYFTGYYKEALSYLDKALELKKVINDKLGIPGIYDYYGIIYTQINEEVRAIDSLNIGLDIATSNKQEALIVRITGHLAEAYAKTENYQIAYIYKDRQYNKYQLVNNLKSTKNLVQLTAIYELEENQKIIKNLEQENRINELTIMRQISWSHYMTVIILSITLILLLITYLYFRNFQTTKDLNRKNKELNCLYNFYRIMEDESDDAMWTTLIQTIPQLMRYPEHSGVRLKFDENSYKTDNFTRNNWVIEKAIKVFNHKIGTLEIVYLKNFNKTEDAFDTEELRLIDILCKHISTELENQTSTQSLVESEQKLRESNATKDKFFSIIAHDLRSPYNSILGFSKILRDTAKEGHTQDMVEFSDLIYLSAQQSFNLLNNLLEWSRSQTGAISFNPDYISIRQIVSDNIRLMNTAVEEKKIHISSNIADDMIYADKNIIDTIVRNLLSNAIKYSFTNGNIIVNAQADKNSYTLSVRDEGIGIPEKNLNKLFKLEESISTEGTKKEKGTGLGLLLCKEFVQIHHGDISAKNNTADGSTFTFHIPLEK